MEILIQKARRALVVLDGGRAVLNCRVALGSAPEGAKRAEGDGRTPEGRYRICLVKENGKYGRSLGLDYPNEQDAALAFAQGRIDERTLVNVRNARALKRRPPWGSPLGGEIYIHEGGADDDWTAGCVALESADMDVLFALREKIEWVEIVP